jgi:hypothetical protein
MKRILIAFLLITLASALHAQDEWELRKEEDGIKVYTRYVEGSDIKAYRVEAILEGKLSSFVAVMKDVKNYGLLFESNDYASLIEDTDTTLVYYSQTGAPWPVKDRDGVYLTHFSQHYGTKIVTARIESVDGIRPENEDFVRIRKATGFWKFLPADKNKVEVIYQMQADPGGNLPAWVINMFLVDKPLQDMKNMRERVKLEEYAGKRYDFLIEY